MGRKSCTVPGFYGCAARFVDVVDSSRRFNDGSVIVDRASDNVLSRHPVIAGLRNSRDLVVIRNNLC